MFLETTSKYTTKVTINIMFKYLIKNPMEIMNNINAFYI